MFKYITICSQPRENFAQCYYNLFHYPPAIVILPYRTFRSYLLQSEILGLPLQDHHAS